MRKTVALGGGIFFEKKKNIFPISMQPIHEKIIKLTGRQHPNVLYIPTAANDAEGYIKNFHKYYAQLGCKVDELRLINEQPTKAEIVAKIESADAIFVTGGNTYRMIATWKKYGVDVLLKKAHRQGTVMAGYSAGAICWFTYGNSDSFSKKKLFRVTALGIFNGLLCPHYDSEPIRQSALKKMMKRTPGMVAIALDEYAAIEIIDDSYRILTGNTGAKARRVFWKKGEYIVENIKQTEDLQDLQNLLTKPRS